MKNAKELAPWWLKIGAKVVLSRLPIPYAYWKSLGFFEHGDMNEVQRALQVVLEHARTADVLDSNGAVPQFQHKGNDYTVLELGPGDSLFTAIIANSLGASQTWLVDSGFFATTAMEPYVELISYLGKHGFSVTLTEGAHTLTEILRECQSEYFTDGVRSLRAVPSKSVDFCFSNAVLEHIPIGEFESLVKELHRVLKYGGIGVHRVDLKDHLGGALNHLRFTSAIWEGALFRNSGFYTNRLRFGEMVALFNRIGFDCEFSRVMRWEALPTSRAKLDDAFRSLPDDDLLVSGFDVVIRHKGCKR